MTPRKRAMYPISPMARSTEALAESNAAADTASIWPVNAAVTKAIRTIPKNTRFKNPLPWVP